MTTDDDRTARITVEGPPELVKLLADLIDDVVEVHDREDTADSVKFRASGPAHAGWGFRGALIFQKPPKDHGYEGV